MRADVDAPRTKLVPTSVHNGDICKPVQQTVQPHSATVSGDGDRRSYGGNQSPNNRVAVSGWNKEKVIFSPFFKAAINRLLQHDWRSVYEQLVASASPPYIMDCHIFLTHT